MKTRNVWNLSFVILTCATLLSACAGKILGEDHSIELRDQKVCFVAGILAAGANCAHTLEGEPEEMDLAQLMKFLEPNIETGESGAAIMSASDFNWMKTTIDIACKKAGSFCTAEMKQKIASITGRIETVQSMSARAPQQQEEEVILKKGSSDKTAVKKLQTQLNTHGFKLTVDGVFGAYTENAVKDFQRDHGLVVDGVVGPQTQGQLDAPPAKLPTPVITGETPWMDIMEAHKGLKEIPGKAANPVIVEMFDYTSYETNSDETPWCAACANWALRKSGYRGTNSAAAKSFDTLGVACDLKYGCVLTIKHPSGGRHVGFFVGFDSKGRMLMLGGNQSNALNVTAWNRSEYVASRWPIKEIA